MKAIAFIASFLVAMSAQAWGGSCANKASELNNISAITTLIDPWGQWEATVNNKKVSVQLSKDKFGAFKGQATFDGKNFGPMGMTLCDYGDSFSFSISFFEIEFEVLSSKTIKIYFEFEGQDSITLKKVTAKKKKA